MQHVPITATHESQNLLIEAMKTASIPDSWHMIRNDRLDEDDLPLSTDEQPGGPDPADIPCEDSNTTTPHLLSSAATLHETARHDNTSALEEIARTYSRRFAEISRSRHRSLSLQTELQNQRAILFSRRDFFKKSSDDFVSKSDTVQANTTRKAVSKLKKLQTRMLADFQALQEQEEATKALELTCRTHEIRLRAAEALFDNAAKALFTTLNGNLLLGGQHLIPDTSLEHSIAASETDSAMSSSELNPNVQHYYDSIGIYRIMQERLSVAEASYGEERVLREFRLDQGRPLDRSDEEFEQYWKQEIANAEADLQKASQAMSRARDVCENEGLAVPFAAGSGMEDLDVTELSALGVTSPPNSIPFYDGPTETIEAPTSETGPMLEEDQTNTQTDETEQIEVKSRIHDWIVEVPYGNALSASIDDTITTAPSRPRSLTSQSSPPSITVYDKPAPSASSYNFIGHSDRPRTGKRASTAPASSTRGSLLQRFSPNISVRALSLRPT